MGHELSVVANVEVLQLGVKQAGSKLPYRLFVQLCISELQAD
jgi:hypothetical protein